MVRSSAASAKHEFSARSRRDRQRFVWGKPTQYELGLEVTHEVFAGGDRTRSLT